MSTGKARASYLEMAKWSQGFECPHCHEKGAGDLVSIIVHIEEAGSADGHVLDWSAVASLLADPEVRAWVAEMTRLGFVPVPRSAILRNHYAGIGAGRKR